MLGLPFKAIPSPAEEVLNDSLEPANAATELAMQKVNCVRELCAEEEAPLIFGADTIVVLNGKIYGKPSDREHAGQMLTELQGKTHEVITGIALYNGRHGSIESCSVCSTVSFAPMSEEEIEWYLNSGEWDGAAGSYQIQGLASCFITGINGSFSSIVGLPVREFYKMLKKTGYVFL